MWNPHISLCKILPHNSNSNYLNILTIQIGFCFTKLDFSSLIRTYIVCFDKKLLVGLVKLFESFIVQDKILKSMDRCTNYSVTIKSLKH